MLKTYTYNSLSAQEVERLIHRNTDEGRTIESTVKSIIDSVRKNGDKELFNLAEKFDRTKLDKLYLDKSEIEDLARSEEHTSELQSRFDLVCRLLLEKKKKKTIL